MTTTELTARLRETPLVEDLDDSEIRRVTEAGAERSVPAGELLLEEGQSRSKLLVILDGEVEVIKDLDTGDEQCLVCLGAHSVLGEMGLLRGLPASATVRTTRETRIFELGYETFHDLLADGETAAYKMTVNIARILGERLERMNQEAIRMCEEFEEALDAAGEVQETARVKGLEEFRATLSRWNF